MTDNAQKCAMVLAQELGVPEWAAIEMCEMLERFNNPNAPVRSILYVRRAKVQCPYGGGLQHGRFDKFHLGGLDLSTHDKLNNVLGALASCFKGVA